MKVGAQMQELKEDKGKIGKEGKCKFNLIGFFAIHLAASLTSANIRAKIGT